VTYFTVEEILFTVSKYFLLYLNNDHVKNKRSIFNCYNDRHEGLSYIDKVKIGVSEVMNVRKSAQEG